MHRRLILFRLQARFDLADEIGVPVVKLVIQFVDCLCNIFVRMWDDNQSLRIFPSMIAATYPELGLIHLELIVAPLSEISLNMLVASVCFSLSYLWVLGVRVRDFLKLESKVLLGVLGHPLTDTHPFYRPFLHDVY